MPWRFPGSTERCLCQRNPNQHRKPSPKQLQLQGLSAAHLPRCGAAGKAWDKLGWQLALPTEPCLAPPNLPVYLFCTSLKPNRVNSPPCVLVR